MARVDASTSVAALRGVVLDRDASIALRNRAAYWLRERAEDSEARAALRAAVKSRGDSRLLRHELAYILGQIGHSDAVADLCAVVRDSTDDAIVRHEAAEALGAIGAEDAVETLVAHADDPAPEVAETCRLALELLAWRRASPGSAAGKNAFRSVDPAPPREAASVDDLKATLFGDDSVPLWDKYRAMFALRDLGTPEAVQALADAVTLPRNQLPSDLLRHELAFVLGQLADQASAPALEAVLRDTSMHAMVRHEAAEALGALQPGRVKDLLADYRADHDDVVAESCLVALDAMAYYHEEQTAPATQPAE